MTQQIYPVNSARRRFLISSALLGGGLVLGHYLNVVDSAQRLIGKPEDGVYSISVEIICQKPKLQDKFTKTFRVGEKKKAHSST